MVSVPYWPTRTVPPAALLLPLATAVKSPVLPTRALCTAWVSALAPAVSGSVSLVSTLPAGSTPAVPLSTPPASVALAVSTTATGASLTATTEMVVVAGTPVWLFTSRVLTST